MDIQDKMNLSRCYGVLLAGYDREFVWMQEPVPARQYEYLSFSRVDWDSIPEARALRKKLMRMLIAGIRRIEDFEIALETYGSAHRAAKQVEQYRRAYTIISLMEQCHLLDDTKRSGCLQLMQKAIRRHAPAQLVEASVIKLVSDKRLDVDLVCDRMFRWLRSQYLNEIANRNPPKRLSWDSFVCANESDSEDESWDLLNDPTDWLASPTKLSWKILPPGRHPFPALIEHFDRLEKETRSPKYDRERLSRMCELEQTDTYVGADKFSGYVVFDYEKYGFAILECPVVGNAVYLLRGRWQHLAKLTKAKLLASHRTKTIRITHSGQWFRRLTETFRILSKQHSRLRSPKPKLEKTCPS